MAKLNAAYSYGGAQLAVDTLEYNFGVDIDHFAAVDFDMFTQIIDKPGGVTLKDRERGEIHQPHHQIHGRERRKRSS